jgi:hypothetical protein
MVRRSLKSLAFLIGAACTMCSSFAQEGAQMTAPPLAFKIAWIRPPSQENTKVRYTPVQENIADKDVEIKYYGTGAKQILTTGAPGSEEAPYGVWSGTAETPFAITFRQKSNYVDLTGLATIKWSTKTSGFHVVRPVVKLANGMLLVADATFASVPRVALSELSLTNVRWIKLDPDKVVTVNNGRAGANPNNEIWIPNPDLSKVDEIGFADLMPGSGNGTGGWIQLGNIEVYGKLIPRLPATSSSQ